MGRSHGRELPGRFEPVKKLEDGKASALSLIANSDTATEKAQQLASLASSRGRSELTGAPASLRRLGAVTTAGAFFPDALSTKGRCEVEGKEAVGYRVLCNVDLGKPVLLLALAGTLGEAGRLSDARKVVDEGLQRLPDDPQWLAASAALLARQGSYGEAVAILEKIAARTDDLGVINNLVWYRYVDGQIDETTEKQSSRIIANEHASEASLHSAAAVLLARGRLPRAAQLGALRLARLDGEQWDDAQWHLKAELLQAFGFREEARAAWAHISDEDVDFARLKARALEELKGAKLAGR